MPAALNLDEEKVVNLYKQGLTTREIGKIMNCSKYPIGQILKKNGVEMKLLVENCRKHFFNEHYFDIIDTEEKAYFLGLLYADGCNFRDNNKVSIGLQEEDKSLLEKFRDCIGYEEELEYNRPYNDKCKIQYRLNLCSKYLCERLELLGCTPKKSLTLKFPTEEQVPKYLQSHFIRGYFDGDGHVGINIDSKWGTKSLRIIVVGTREFLGKTQEIIIKELGFRETNLYKPKVNHYNTVVMTYGGNKQMKLFKEWLYKDATVYMERKFKRFQNTII